MTAPTPRRLVPATDTEEMWSGLARDIVMWSHFGLPTGRELYNHLRALGHDIPDWLPDLIPDIKHVPPKGAVAGAIYRAMLAAAPHAGRVSREDVERVARALVRRQIEINRRWDTPPERLAGMIDGAVDYAWRDRREDAEIALTALGLEIEPAQEAGE
jgi:hypothetical protein